MTKIVHKHDLMAKSLFLDLDTAKEFLAIHYLEKSPDDQLKLPLIIPIVFYNGKRSPYPYSSNIADMFADKDLYEKFGRIGTFKLIDLTVIDDDEIKQHKKIAAMEFAMKHISDRDLLLKLDEIVGIIAISAKYGLGAKLIGNAMVYLAADREQQEAAVFMSDVVNKLHNYRDEIMTYREALEQKGRQECRLEVAVEFLRAGDSVEKVARCTHLPLIEVERLQKQIAH